MKVKRSEVAQSCPTLCDSMDCNLSGSSVHGIFQAIALEWIAISFSSGSSRPRDWTQVSPLWTDALPSEPPGKSLACEMSVIVRSFEHSLALPFFGTGVKTDLFQSCGHCWFFQICWHIEFALGLHRCKCGLICVKVYCIGCVLSLDLAVSCLADLEQCTVKAVS